MKYFVFFAAFIASITLSSAYPVEFYAKSIFHHVKPIPKPLKDGTKLIDWLGGDANIEKIVIGKPYLNINHATLSESLIKSRIKNAVSVDSIVMRSGAPYTTGNIYLKDGRVLSLYVDLSDLAVDGHIFEHRAEQGAAANP